MSHKPLSLNVLLICCSFLRTVNTVIYFSQWGWGGGELHVSGEDTMKWFIDSSSAGDCNSCGEIRVSPPQQ